MNANTIRAIGEMDLDLCQRAQNLVLEKTKEFMAIQEAEIEKARNKFLEIEEKFAGKPSYDAMIMATQNKLASAIDGYLILNFFKFLSFSEPSYQQENIFFKNLILKINPQSYILTKFLFYFHNIYL